MARMVQCVKLGRLLPGLERPPVAGELGQRVYEQVSHDAWQMWLEHMTRLINHYGLVPADPEARKILRQEMEEFFFGEGAQMPEGWVPEGAAGGKGGAPGGKGGGAPPSKGG
ncbi:MAG: oxidative damage protection protein [Chloroflexi bacterium]|nr:oxidative damage protection protein [Chloroflexota bacterium]MBI4506654.1 oxidative damage protection protein [Chloroflexota bacterium]